MIRLTAHMRDALTHAQHAPLRRPHPPGPGAPPWPAPAATLHALVRQELVICGEIRNRHGWPVTTWTITAAGHAALKPPERFLVDRPVYLADRRKATVDWYDPDAPERHDEDYTNDPRRRLDDVEVTDPDVIALVWIRRAEEHHAAAQNRRQHARQLAANARAA